MSQIGESHLRSCVKINLHNAATVQMVNCAKTHPTHESNQISYNRLQVHLRSTIKPYIGGICEK